MKSKLEQFNLLDEATAEDAQLRDQGEPPSIHLLSSHHSTKPIGDPTEQLDAHDALEYSAQDGEGDENPTSEGPDQATTEQPTDDAGSGVYAADFFNGGESSNEVEPEQAQPADDERSNPRSLSGDELAAAAEDDSEQGTTTVTASDDGYPGSAEDLDAAAVHERLNVRNTPPLGGNSTDYGEVIATNDGHEADYNETDRNSEPGEAVTIGGDTASDVQQTRDDPEVEGGTEGTDEREQVVHFAIVDDLTPPPTDPHTLDLTVPGLDDDPTAVQQGTQLPSAVLRAPSNLTVEIDTDSIGQQTLDEFADAQEESRDDRHPHEEGEESNSNTGKSPFSTSSLPTLTQPLDQSNELIPDLDQFGDDFNWDEDFGGDFDDGELGEFEDQDNVETKRVGSQEPVSGRSSKRGFDEVDSDTADEEEAPGDVSPSKLLSASMRSSRLTRVPSRFKTEEGAVV